jgi:hypothetical protein
LATQSWSSTSNKRIFDIVSSISNGAPGCALPGRESNSHCRPTVAPVPECPASPNQRGSFMVIPLGQPRPLSLIDHTRPEKIQRTPLSGSASWRYWSGFLGNADENLTTWRAGLAGLYHKAVVLRRF